MQIHQTMAASRFCYAKLANGKQSNKLNINSRLKSESKNATKAAGEVAFEEKRNVFVPSLVTNYSRGRM